MAGCGALLGFRRKAGQVDPVKLLGVSQGRRAAVPVRTEPGLATKGPVVVGDVLKGVAESPVGLLGGRATVRPDPSIDDHGGGWEILSEDCFSTLIIRYI